MKALSKQKILTFVYMALALAMIVILFFTKVTSVLHSLLLVTFALTAVTMLHEMGRLEVAVRKLKEAADPQTHVNRLSAYLNEMSKPIVDERNDLLALLAHVFPSGTHHYVRPLETYPENTRKFFSPTSHTLFIDTPGGQVSFAYGDADVEFFSGLPAYTGEWDGHTRSQVGERLAAAATRTGLVPTAWIEHWAADRKLIALKCMELHAHEERAIIDQAEHLESDMHEFVLSRANDPAYVQPNWVEACKKLVIEFRQIVRRTSGGT